MQLKTGWLENGLFLLVKLITIKLIKNLNKLSLNKIGLK
jgi:hypothetical protein